MFGQQMERGCGSYQCETGVVSLSRDPKPRLRWTPDLHDRFVDAVTKLGGPHSKSALDLFNFAFFFHCLLVTCACSIHSLAHPFYSPPSTMKEAPIFHCRIIMVRIWLGFIFILGAHHVDGPLEC